MPLGERISVLNSCMAVPAATVPAYILSVTSPPPASAPPLKECAWLMLSLPLIGTGSVHNNPALGRWQICRPHGSLLLQTAEQPHASLTDSRILVLHSFPREVR